MILKIAILKKGIGIESETKLMLRRLLACQPGVGALFGIARVHIYVPYFPRGWGNLRQGVFSHPPNPYQCPTLVSG